MKKIPTALLIMDGCGIAPASERNAVSRAATPNLDRLASGDGAEVPAMHGWRREVFGEAAQALKTGKLALGVDGKRVKLIPAG